MKRLGLRARLHLAVGTAVAIALAGLFAGFNVILAHALDRDARDLARARAVAEIGSLRLNDGRVSVGETPDDRAADSYLWVFVGSHTIEQPRVVPAIDHAAQSLAGGPSRYLDVPTTDTRLYAAPITAEGRRLGTVVAGISLAPYEETRKLALIASLVLGGTVLVLVVFVARWLLTASLRPVVRMTRQAADWSERDLDHRFALGAPNDELTELAATLDGLLDRLAASIRRERRFSAELSHELRTPLARVLAESELALRRDRPPSDYRDALQLIRRNADQLARTIDSLVAAARYEAGGARGTADAHAVAVEAASTYASLAAGRRLQLTVDPPPHTLRIGVDADLATRIIQPVLENACRYSSTRVRIGIRHESSSIVYAVEDDGPGVAANERDRIFEPGVRGSAARDSEPGAGLGLALARRLARAIDGDVISGTAASGGCFLVRLPAA